MWRGHGSALTGQVVAREQVIDDGDRFGIAGVRVSMKRTLALLLCIGLLALPIGFLPDALLPERFPPRGGDVPDELAAVPRPDTRGRYLDALAADDAVATGPQAAWRRAGERALETPLPIDLPYAEHVVLADGGAGASVFALSLSPPEVLHLRTAAGEGAVGGLLVDVLQRRGERFAPLLTSGPADIDVRWEPPVGGRYLVRVQPVLASAGAFSLSLGRRAPLDFPVLTDAPDPIRSRFGASRDGGRREHHGIDIFAPRGTPVLAAADGVVVRSGNSGRGGLHVWQQAETASGQRLGSLYYAHLDAVEVLAGTRVTRGTRLGTVGNTGNARTTPPHLHFGLYRRYRGPVDPLPLVGERRVVPPPLPATDGSPPAAATWLAVRPRALNLRAGPGIGSAVLGQIDGGELVRSMAVSGSWVRVRTRSAGGGTREGYVSRALLDAVAPEPAVLERERALLAAPEIGTPRLAVLASRTTVAVSGVFGGYRRVETPEGLRGWLAPDGQVDERADGSGGGATAAGSSESVM